jgi:predicted RNA-binding protein YlqC (UPF0109 family)
LSISNHCCFNHLSEPPAKQQKVEEDATAQPDEPSAKAEENEASEETKETASGLVEAPTDTAEESKKQESSAQSESTSQAEEKEETSTAKAKDAPSAQAAADSKAEEKAAAPTPSPSASARSSHNAPAATRTPNGLPAGLPTSTPTPVSNPETIVEERGEVSALYVGRVIGKGGEMIRDLQARSSCRIDVDQNVPAGQPRVITYRGSRRTVDFAKRLVHMLCQESASETDLPLGEAKREFLVVPSPSVGKIIGRGGEMIRELQSRSQAKIQVDHSGNSGLDQSEKQVTITGSDQAVTKAREMVLFLVANPMMDAMQSINMLVEDKVHKGGIWGSGPPYLNLQNQGQGMQPNAGGGGYGYEQPQQGFYGGSGGSHGAPPAYGAPAPAAYGAPAPAYAAAQPAYQQQAAQQSYGQYGGSGGVEMEIFYIAKNFMGRIIGQKGVTINDLQRRSACDLQINQDVPPQQDCEISMRGSRQGIEMVKQMLREIIEIGKSRRHR